MAFVINNKYEDRVVEAQQNYVTQDPFGNKFVIFSGQQFKYVEYSDNTETGECYSCSGKTETTYRIDAYAHCCEGEYLWPRDSGVGGLFITVESSVFQETESLKFPPVLNDIADESSGKNTDLFTPPWERKIPREGGLWYEDPWFSKRDG